MCIWSRVAGFLVVGYLSMARSFAYLGVPPIFIGEVVLAAFLLLKPRVALGTWAMSLLRASPLSGLGLALLIFMLYGLWQMGRGILEGSPVIVHTQIFHLQLLCTLSISWDLDRTASSRFSVETGARDRLGQRDLRVDVACGA
jgi:hypothetical protein